MFLQIPIFNKGFLPCQYLSLKLEKKCATIPLLIIHDEKDNFVPLYMAYDIYHHKIRDEEKQISELLIIKDAGHVQSITTDYDLYTSKTLLFAKIHEEITN
ncbi:alpha/beta hydrolase [Spiroplasma endosymbiont of Clivina fossor]|uniref:alpha/beta hydrolase n=1 Tax=Spiroplasma endosymbiont of Clivina fossor TaxID=3066282 RepID=UPI00313E7D75